MEDKEKEDNLPQLDGVRKNATQEDFKTKNKVYELLGEILVKKGYGNMKVVNLSERDSVGQAVAFLKSRHSLSRGAQVEIVPLVIAWGDYMANVLFSTNDSFMFQLRNIGYRTVFTGKGLGEYPEFRRIYLNRVESLLNK